MEYNVFLLCYLVCSIACVCVQVQTMFSFGVLYILRRSRSVLQSTW